MVIRLRRDGQNVGRMDMALEKRSPFPEWTIDNATSRGKQVEGNVAGPEQRLSLSGAAGEASLQLREVKACLATDDDLTVQHAGRPQCRGQPGSEVGEVGVECLAVATVDVEPPAVEMHECSKAV